jgi:hypothetical protein
MAYDQDAVDAAISALRPEIQAVRDELVRRIEALEARPSGNALFAARDDFETALFSAMQDMSDADQIAFLTREADRLRGTV